MAFLFFESRAPTPHRSAQWPDTHLSRLPCSGQLCLGPKSPRSLFSGKKGSLGIPEGVTQEETIRVRYGEKNRTLFNKNKTVCRLCGKKSQKLNISVQKQTSNYILKSRITFKNYQHFRVFDFSPTASKCGLAGLRKFQRATSRPHVVRSLT